MSSCLFHTKLYPCWDGSLSMLSKALFTCGWGEDAAVSGLSSLVCMSLSVSITITVSLPSSTDSQLSPVYWGKHWHVYDRWWSLHVPACAHGSLSHSFTGISQCVPFQPGEHWHRPASHVPPLWHAWWSHISTSQRKPVKPSRQWQTPPGPHKPPFWHTVILQMWVSHVSPVKSGRQSHSPWFTQVPPFWHWTVTSQRWSAHVGPTKPATWIR